MTLAPTRHAGLLRAAIVVVVASLLLALAGWWIGGRTAPPPARTPNTGAPLNWAAALARVDQALAGDRERITGRGDEWLMEERQAIHYLARARLTGSFDDYAGAQAALDRGFATAPAGAGPHMAAAVLAFTVHRLGGVAAMLAAMDRYAVPPEYEDRIEMAAMRGDLLFYRGRYEVAERFYRTANSPFRTAVLAANTGRPDEALAAIDAAERTARWPTAQTLANYALQRGGIALRRGDRETAAADFARADRLFPGSWLVEAHRAQMLALAGDRRGAARRFEAIVKRIPDPMAMDMLASLYRADGDYARSTAWAKRAGEGWAARLRLFPQAAYGHAVEHELAFGDPRRALDLARRDFAARPYGATAIALGWALLATNRPTDALAAVRPVLASAWVSADQHLVAAQALALLGRGEEADAEKAKALAINPHAADGDAALIWFGH